MNNITVRQLAERVTRTGSLFFSPVNMSAFGDSFSNYELGLVTIDNVECIALIRKKPVTPGFPCWKGDLGSYKYSEFELERRLAPELTSTAYFRADNYKQVFIKE